MRNKLIAHITKPDAEISIATYRELFDITQATAQMWHLLARGTGQASFNLEILLEGYRNSLEVFWSRWSGGNPVQPSD